MPSSLNFSAESSSAIYDHLNELVAAMNQIEAGLIPKYAGGEAVWAGSPPPAGARIVEREWVASAVTVGSGGGVTFAYPQTFTGITSFLYVPMDQSRRLSTWWVGPVSCILTATNLSGDYTAAGTTIWASLRVVGWVA